MTKLMLSVGMVIAGFLAVPRPQDAPAAVGKPTVVLGTFDSRAVATAWIRSAAFREYLGGQRKDIQSAIDRAKTAGDRALAAELEALGPGMQSRVHAQGFGTAPVDDVIARIADRLPAIAAKAGVDVIVSKWAITHGRDAARTVDVTDLLVAEFAPDDATLAVIRELVKSEPVPLDQLDHHR